MAELWADLEARFSKRPLPPPAEERAVWLPSTPSWLAWGRPELERGHLAWERLYRDGALVWGAIFAASRVLWTPGDIDAPASVLYGFDPAFRKDLSWLGGAHFRLGLLREPERIVPPGLGRMAQLARDDQGHELQVPLSDRITSGRSVFHSNVMIYRRQLPTPQVTGVVLPLLARPGVGEPCLVVPERYWPEALRQEWREAVESEGG